jgi:chromosome segregation ATPase
MKTITLKEFAQTHSVSYEAVRRQIVRHEDELSTHIIKRGRQRFLDEWAVNYLEQHRRENPVTSVRQDQLEEIETLKETIANLTKQLLEAQHQNVDIMKQLNDHIEVKVRNEYLLEDRTRLQTEIEQFQKEQIELKTELNSLQAEISAARTEISSAQAELSAAKAEAESFHKTIFGFYRKK